MQADDSNIREVKLELHKKQGEVLKSPANEIAYGGAAGAGKSFLARALAIIFCMLIPGLQCYFFRRHHKDLILNHMEGESGFRALLAPFILAGAVEIVAKEIRFSNGSRIYMNSCKNPADVYKFQGAEIHFLVIEESTQFIEDMVRYLRSRVRMSKKLKATIPKKWQNKFPFILYTMNPGGVGHEYFKTQFVDKGDGIYKASDEEGGFTRQFVQARLNDNPSLDPVEYARTLSGLKTPEMVKALLEGDWNVAIGAFFKMITSNHYIPNIIEPTHLTRFGGFDWGHSAPAAFLKFAVADGQPIPTKQGGEVWVKRGALIVYDELYMCDSKSPSMGACLSNEQIIKAMHMRGAGDLPFIVTDSLPFQARGGKKLAEEYRQSGIKLVRGDDSRVPGWAQMISRLMGIDGDPLLVFTESCHHIKRTLQTLQIDDNDREDVDTTGEDHLADVIRLACMTRPLIKKKAPDPLDIYRAPSLNEAISRNKQERQRSRF